MSRIIYHKRATGREPTKEWINEQDTTVQATVFAKLDSLKDNWNTMLKNDTLKQINGKYREHGFYELRNLSYKWRLFLYHDLTKESFVLLGGYRKTKPSKKEQEEEIRKAHEMLLEYRGS